jgi:tetratricopeptide (TPR) repeat protein
MSEQSDLTIKVRRRLFGGLILVGIACGAQAADKTPSLSQSTYRSLQTSRELLDADKVTQAVERLESLVKQTAHSPYEQAVSLQALAHAYIDQGDYRTAIPYLKRSLDLQALPDEAQQRSRYNLAQLYLATERFKPAIEQLERWFKSAEEPKPQAYLMLGSAHLQLNQYRQAVTPLRKAIALSQTPKESWYQTLLGAYHELKEYQESVRLLHRMLKLFPENSDYWKQLSAMEMTRKNTAQALAVMELAYLRGQLTEQRDLLNLAQLYAMRNAPYKAARLLQDEIAKGRLKPSARIWEQLANAWHQAREMPQSIEALERAVDAGGGTELSLRLAQLYLESRRLQEAEKRLLEIIKQPDSKHGEQAWLLLGIARYEADSPKLAKQAFSQAVKFDKTRKQASQWLAFLKNQK